LDRQALPEPDTSALITRSYEAPVGETETALAEIWQALLGMEQVGRHDHFFELGGHSLMIVSLIERLHELGWQLDVHSVFATPVLAEMAQAVQLNADTFIVPPNRIPADCTAITPDMLPLVSLSQAEIDTLVEATSGGVSNIQDIYPLAPLQEGILFHHLLQTQGDDYLLQSLLAFDSRERLDTFLTALQQVIDRHDTLRTAACWQGLTQPVQVVWRQAPLSVNVFIPATAEDVAAQLQAYTDPRRYRLDLSRAPLFAADIAHDPGQDEWLLALRFHHLVCDHMTLALIFAEIAQILQCEAETLPPTLPYRNFIARTLSVPAAVHEAYFRAQLAGIDEPTAPFGILKVQSDNQAVSQAHLPLGPMLAEAIRTQARHLGVSPSVLFHVAWAQVLAQTSGRDDVVFGSVLLGRLQGIAGVSRTLGLFINTLPVRLSLAGLSVQEAVQAIYRSLTTLLEHEQASLALAQRCSGVDQSMPLFSTLLNYRHSQTDGIEMTQAGIRIVATEERSHYPLTLSIDDLGVDFRLTVLAVTDIDPHRVITYLVTAISGLVETLAHTPQERIQALPILPSEERQKLLVDFNATQADFPQDALIHQLFETQAAQHPDTIAVLFEEQTISYGELNIRANRLAHYLITLGVRPDDRVAICVERSPEMVVGLLAILKAGGAYVPLDPAYPAERLAYMLEDAAPVVLLTQTLLMQTTQPDRLASPTFTVTFDDLEQFLTAQPTHNPDVQTLGLTSHHLAYVIYTSGSTGMPKGVMVEHRGLTNLIVTQQNTLAITSNSRILQFASNSFDACIWECCMALLSGACLHLASRIALLPGVALLETLEIQAITHVLLPPAALAALDTIPATLETLLVGGEACPSSQVKRWATERRMINAYGPTESTVCSAMYLCNSQEEGAPPIGHPIANTQIYILDPHGQPVPLDAIGEIYIAGVGVARGYLNRPELTAERFLPDPFSADPGARMYKTGDLGRWRSDGNIDYLGRNDFQVKLRGFRIEPGEIEAKLMQCHGVKDAVVLVREDEPNQKRLVAYLCPLAGGELIPAELRQQLAQHLADYMLPSAFVTLEAFPLTPNGKLDRQALPAPDLSAVVARGYEAPFSETEIILAQIWQDLLKVEQVGRYDHFFELGGHSLLAVQLTSRVRQTLARELPIQQLFTCPLLADLAQVLTHASATEQIVISPVARNQALPLSFAQQRLWFLHQLDPAASLAYYIPVALRLTGQLNQHALLTALDCLIARHESLRTRFVLIDGQPCQHIDSADIDFALACQDLRQFASEEQTHRIAELAVTEAQTPFNLTKGPLVRGQLLQLTDEEHVLLLTLHHIIADGWSVGVLVHELGAIYQATLDGHADPLPPLPIQYSDYAVWQHDWLQGNVLAVQRDFWCQQLADAPALLALPVDRPRPPVQTYRGSQVSFELDASLLASLKKLGQHHNTTLFMTLLAAWSIVLSRLSGQDDIVIGTPVTNRPHHKLEGLIGFFVNTLALRVTLSDNPCVADLLTQVRERALAAYAHQDLPFEQVVETLQPERSLSYSPIFQVMLALNNTPSQALTLPGLQLTPIKPVRQSAQFDLTLFLTETDAGLTGDLEYATDLFDSATVERIAGYFRQVLAAMVADATQPIVTLPMLPGSERQQLLADFNATQTDFPQDALIHQLIETQVARTPGAMAVICGEQSLSYEELNNRANRLAHYLIALGVQPDDRVAICVERNLEMVVGLLAILKAGGAYMPLDPAYPTELLAYMLEDAAPVALLTQTILVGKLNIPAPTVVLDAPDVSLTSQPTHNPDIQNTQKSGLTSHHLAYVIYTSGSTGQPKGVAITHCNAVNFLTWAQRTFSPEELAHTLFATSLNFDLAVYECFAPLISGGTVHLVSDVLSLVTTEQPVSLINTVPSAITQLIEANALPVTIQTVNLAGEASKPHVIEHLFARSSVQDVCNLYGPSETTTYSTWTRMNRAAGFVSHIGRPIANTQIYLLDLYGQPVPLGVTGEIHIAGAGVARGYLNRPELTAERFLPDPFSSLPDARMYKTGDLGRWLPDGNLEYLGRNDFQVKLRGFRIELGEIEARLMQCHGVREAVVLAREYISHENNFHENNSHKNLAGQKRLIAYILPQADIKLVPAELRQQLAQYLAGY
ncbi:amino acid adenylation domain-containing protein, partial [Xenorhabdus sp. Flor]|uniref:non-ribosomal peptide synthetase n=1 Tax=Xenorhabdus cabanillasii TaxID=351673 RepID=UPI0019CE7657